MVALSIPCGVLVGTLMAFGRMAQDNEILAMRSSGLSPARLLRPAFLWGVGWTAFMLVFNHWILPETNHEFSRLMNEIRKSKPTAKLEAGVFIDNFDGHQVMFDELDRETGRLSRDHPCSTSRAGGGSPPPGPNREPSPTIRKPRSSSWRLVDGDVWAVPGRCARCRDPSG